MSSNPNGFRRSWRSGVSAGHSPFVAVGVFGAFSPTADTSGVSAGHT